MVGPRKRASKKPSKALQEIDFHLIKSGFFRAIHADGAWGGVSPQGTIQMTLFNERQAIPTKLVYQVADDGTLSKEVIEKRETRSGYVRELEVEVILNLDSAEAVYLWLGETIKKLKEAST